MHQHILDTEIAAYLRVNESDGIIWSFFGIFLVVVGAMVSGEVDVVVRGTPVVAEEAAGLTVGSEPAAEETVSSHCCAGFFVAGKIISIRATSSWILYTNLSSSVRTYLLPPFQWPIRLSKVSASHCSSGLNDLQRVDDAEGSGLR